jgi:hypothetical protein
LKTGITAVYLLPRWLVRLPCMRHSILHFVQFTECLYREALSLGIPGKRSEKEHPGPGSVAGCPAQCEQLKNGALGLRAGRTALLPDISLGGNGGYCLHSPLYPAQVLSHGRSAVGVYWLMDK